MYASTAGEADVLMWMLLADLQELYGLEDRNGARACVRAAPGARWNEYGVREITRWFNDPTRRCVAEVMSIYAEAAAKLGLLETEQRYDADAWVRAGFVDGKRFRGVELYRDQVSDTVGPPSLVVDRRVYCYAPTDEAGGWAFLDFEQWQGADHNPRLLDVRLPRVPASAGLVMTK